MQSSDAQGSKQILPSWTPRARGGCGVTCKGAVPYCELGSHKAQSTQSRLAWDLNIHSGLPDGPKAQFKELNYSKHGWALTGLAFEEKWDTRCPKLGTLCRHTSPACGQKKKLVFSSGTLSKFKLKSSAPGEVKAGPGNALQPLDVSVDQQWVKDVCLEISNSVHMTKTQVLARTHGYLVLSVKYSNVLNPPNLLMPSPWRPWQSPGERHSPVVIVN